MKKIGLSLVMIMSLFMFCFKVHANNQVIEDGIYVIHSASNENYVLDIANGNIRNNGNVQLYQRNHTDAQKFKIKNLGDGYYEISSYKNQNYVLDVADGKLENNGNVQLYQRNNTNAQKWRIRSLEDGYYEICSYNESLTLDIKNGKIMNSSNIQLYEKNSTIAQKFKLEKIFFGEKSIENGLYTISSALDSNKVLDIANGNVSNFSNIQLYQRNNTNAQKWYIYYLGNGYYSIKSYSNLNYVIDVASAGKTNGTNTQLYQNNNSEAQKWIIRQGIDGYYNIISPISNLSIDVANGSSANGSNIWLYAYNGTQAQRFKFDKVIEKGEKSIDDGCYYIKTNLDSNKVLDISGGTIKENNNIQIYQWNYSLAQKWDVKYLGDGYYSILSDKDNEYGLEYDNEHNNVALNKYTGKSNQKWIIRKSVNGYYLITLDGKYVDIKNGSSSNGTNVGIYDFNGSNAQKFNLKRTFNGLSERSIDDGIYRIVSGLNPLMTLDIKNGSSLNGTNVQLYQSNGSNAQKWQVKYLSNGYYKISSLIDLTKQLDVQNGMENYGANVQIYANNNSMSQEWIIKDVGDGYYNIVSNINGLYLDVTNAQVINGNNIQLWKKNDNIAQKFKFIKSDIKTKILDVSYHQGTIDWDKVADSGIYGVILRIGYYKTEDERFSEYIKEVKRLGVPYGIYLYSYSSTTNGANIEADFTKNMISKYDLNPTLGIYYDIEHWTTSSEDSYNISKSQYDNIIGTYINNVSNYVGTKYKVKVYTYTNYANNYLGDYSRSQIDWIADYRSSCGYKGNYSLWQYTSEATLDGIRGFVDMSYLY